MVFCKGKAVCKLKDHVFMVSLMFDVIDFAHWCGSFFPVSWKIWQFGILCPYRLWPDIVQNLP